MDLSTKFALMGDTQIQEVLRELDSDDLKELMVYHLDDQARNILAANMSVRAWEEIRKDVAASRNLEQRVGEIIDSLSGLYAESSRGVILFTDLVNSTVRQNILGDTDYYEQVITVHNEIMHGVIGANFGRIIKTIGDAFLATFAEAWRALLAAIQLLDELEKHNQNATEQQQIVVRLALHSGEFSYKRLANGAVDIYGTDVNYAARIVGISAGGEIWFSRAFADVLETNLDRLKQLSSGTPVGDDPAELAQRHALDAFLTSYSPQRVRSLGLFSFKGYEEDQELFTLDR